MTDLHTTVQRLADAQAVRDLGYRFADACNRGDVDAFRALWADDGVWIIDDPVGVRADGADTIANTLAGLAPQWDFFVQTPHAPVVQVDGDRATSSWTMSELADSAARGRGYFNYGRYDDELVRTPDGWRFRTRHYHYLFLDQNPLPQAPTVHPARAAGRTP